MENAPFIDDVPIKMVMFHGELLNNQRVYNENVMGMSTTMSTL